MKVYPLLITALISFLMEQSLGWTNTPSPYTVPTTQSDSTDYEVIIVGGGIAGLSTAAALLHDNQDSNKGNYSNCATILSRQICILEKSRSIRPIGATIGLFPNGVTALEAISPLLANRVCGLAILYRGIIRHDIARPAEEVTTLLPPSNLTDIGRGIYSIAWYILQRELYEMIPTGVLQLGKIVESISFSEDDNAGNSIITVTYRDRQTNELEQKTCRILIGADGIKSTVRDILFPEYKLMFDDQHDLGRKMFRAIISKASLLKQLRNKQQHGIMREEDILPPEGFTRTYICKKTDRVFAMRKVANDTYAFTSAMNPGGTVDASDDVPGMSENILTFTDSKATASKWNKLCKCFRDFPPVVQHWIHAVEDNDAIYENDVCDIDMLTRWSRNNCILIGDAAHAMSPSLGQGANVGLEDAVELAAVIRPILLKSYQGEEKRKEAGEGEGKGKTTRNKFLEIQSTLEDFEHVRIDRIEKIHNVSRQNRKSGDVDPSFKSWVYRWQPSF